MSPFECLLLLDTVVGVTAGSWGICWARTATNTSRRLWGRCLFVGTLVLLGAGGLAAAWQRADGLVPLDLSAGLLVVAMLWEGPQSALPMAQAIAPPEET
jgi:hypothetical protein